MSGEAWWGEAKATALSSAVRRNELTAFANAPRYDRLVLSCKRTDTLSDWPRYEGTASAQDAYWSSRAIFVHGIKGPAQFASVRNKWTIKRPDAYLGLRCFSCESGGTNGHNGDWLWARLPCPTRQWDSPPHTATGTVHKWLQADVPAMMRVHGEKLEAALADVVRSGMFINGPRVQELEGRKLAGSGLERASVRKIGTGVGKLAQRPLWARGTCLTFQRRSALT